MDKAELLDSIADYLLYDSYGTPASGRCSKKGFFSVPNLNKTFSGNLIDLLAYLFQNNHMNPGYYGGSGDEYSGSSGSWGWGLDIIPVDILKNGVVYGKIKNIKENGKTYLGVKVQEIPKADLVNEFKSKNGFVNYVREKWKPRGFELHERGKSSYLDRLEESASNLYRTKTHNCF